MFLATREASVFGRYLTQMDIVLFGVYHRWVAAPILVVLGIMILVKKASWSMSRFAGILLFYTAIVSLIGWYTSVYASDSYASFFNVWSLLERFLGRSSGFLFLIVLFFASLYLTLRISYRTILSRVRDSVPSMSRMREAILPTDDDEDEAPVRKSKTDDVYKKKAEELERKIAELHKGKKTEAPVHEPK
jgi:predicted membrane protein